MQSAVKVWRRQKKDKQLLGLSGVVESWTTMYVAPPKFQKQTPYTVALVRLENNELVYGELVDVDANEPKIGIRVKSVLRTIGHVGDEDLIEYGIKFQPI